ncbi:hypothetical protein [Thalassotalea castellviae]|uniref:Class II aldolase/adducin N-terminal domain-containing protein n=1 Tax=Thalassotalea castellviae TaxID=3075612 RepID=A0ABU2ZZ36_9GAMM|nr:hypothetical protein [Thalassotalea sp. W431]MDT0603186.1 hypothetical protein [Thalassotalea sp. W431]
MAQNSLRDPLIERRSSQNNFDELWSNLTLAQKFAASSLTKYGYKLSYIRCSSAGNVAFMTVDDNVATIEIDGEINTTPSVFVR